VRHRYYTTPAVNVLLERLANLHPAGPGRWRATCPAHGSDRNRALSIAVKDGKILLHCFGGCDPDAVLSALGLSWHELYAGETCPWEAPVHYRPAPAPARPEEGRRRYLERLWAEARPIQHSEVGAAYLKARGLQPERVENLNLRVHPGLDYRDGERVLGRYPVLLGRVEHPRYGLVALHRTYLCRDGSGKAPVPSPKKLTPPVFEGATAGASIRLYPLEADKPLALCEGIETSLAVHQATGWPCWACVSAGGLERVILPTEVAEVLIAADHDRAGLEAARKLARRLLSESRRVRLAVPPVAGTDWLDVLNESREVVAC